MVWGQAAAGGGDQAHTGGPAGDRGRGHTARLPGRGAVHAAPRAAAQSVLADGRAAGEQLCADDQFCSDDQLLRIYYSGTPGQAHFIAKSNLKLAFSTICAKRVLLYTVHTD